MSRWARVARVPHKISPTHHADLEQWAHKKQGNLLGITFDSKMQGHNQIQNAINKQSGIKVQSTFSEKFKWKKQLLDLNTSNWFLGNQVLTSKLLSSLKSSYSRIHRHTVWYLQVSCAHFKD